MSVTSLKSILNPNKSVTVDFPGIAGFTVNLNYLARETLVSMRKKATTSVFKKGRLVDEFSEDLFMQLYSKAAIKGWKGLTMERLATLISIDDVEDDQLEVELEFSEENALNLMKGSTAFDGFVSDTVGELSNFQKDSGKK